MLEFSDEYEKLKCSPLGSDINELAGFMENVKKNLPKDLVDKILT